MTEKRKGRREGREGVVGGRQERDRGRQRGTNFR